MGGGIGMGNTCKPMAVSFQCMTKFTTNKKKLKKKYWSGLPFPPPGGLSNPGIKPTSLALAGGFFFTAERPGKPLIKHLLHLQLCSWCLGYNDTSVVIVPIRY